MQFDHAQTQLSAANHSDDHPAHFTSAHGCCHFDNRLDTLMNICAQLILRHGVFHISIHFSSSQLVCWTYDNPYSFQVYSAEEVFSEQFLRLFAPLDSHLHTCIPRDKVDSILQSLKSLRLKQTDNELRNAGIHMINGYITLAFACDDTRYISFRNFIRPGEIGLS